MRIHVLFVMLVIFLSFGGSARGVCPADTNDRGICDTMYVEPWPDDTLLKGDGPYFARFLIYVTCDVVDSLDSISGFTIPLCYTHTNASKYCSVSSWWNTTSVLWVFPDFSTRSIFRHMVEGTDTLYHNRMAQMGGDFSGREWDSITLDLDGTSHFWLAMIPTGTADQRWWDGSRVLLATLTFKLEDSMRICIDTCPWPPHSSLAWATRWYGTTKIPRPGTGDPNSFRMCANFRKPSEVREIEGGDEESSPSGFSLSQNYPNPFNPATSFQFSLSKPAYVKIEIFNIVGQRVRRLVDEKMMPGVYVVDWDGKDERGNPVSSGIYFYRMQAGDFSDMKKMVLLK